MGKVLDLKMPGVMELGREELKEVEGGNPWALFVAGAIVGGIIYDAYKTACFALAEWQINNPDLVNVGSKR